MKKLLIILFLFFPVHGAWAEKIRGMFGYDLGMSESDIPKENILPPTEKQKLTYLLTNPNGGIFFNVKPIIKNKNFDVYTLYFTPISKKLYKIKAISNKKSPSQIPPALLNINCKENMRSVKNVLLKKYNSLSEFTEEKELKKLKEYISDEEIKEFQELKNIPVVKKLEENMISLSNRYNSINIGCQPPKFTRLSVSISNFEINRINRKEIKLNIEDDSGF